MAAAANDRDRDAARPCRPLSGALPTPTLAAEGIARTMMPSERASAPTPKETASRPLLVVENVRKAFGGVHAVESVSFQIEAGHVQGLIGPNGAGKTTVINIISGLLRADGGTIHLLDRRIDQLPPHKIAALGVRRTHQNIRLFAKMSVLDNVTVGQHLLRRETLVERLVFAPRGRAESARLHAEAEALLARVGLQGRARVPAAALSYGDQRRLEIARALASHPRLLLLDEPAAGMNHTEAAALGELMRDLAAQGLTILLVEHNVQLVMDVCDRVTVLNFGRVIAHGTPAEVTRDPEVIAAYLGTDEETG